MLQCIDNFVLEKHFATSMFKVLSMHNRNMKHTHAIEFDQTNLLAML